MLVDPCERSLVERAPCVTRNVGDSFAVHLELGAEAVGSGTGQSHSEALTYVERQVGEGTQFPSRERPVLVRLVLALDGPVLALTRLGDRSMPSSWAGRLSFFLVFVGTLEWCQTY